MRAIRVNRGSGAARLRRDVEPMNRTGCLLPKRVRGSQPRRSRAEAGPGYATGAWISIRKVKGRKNPGARVEEAPIQDGVRPVVHSSQHCNRLGGAGFQLSIT